MSNTREELRTVYIHERDFQKYSIDHKIYCVPVDDREEERLGVQHEILLRLCGYKLFFPQIDNPSKILDCGYGRGEWAVAVAEDYEDCEVTGIDIYPLPLPDQPENLALFGYNLNDKITEVCDRNSYDLVHSRFVNAGIKSNRWGPYIREIKALLRPNGWAQVMEYYPNIQSDNGRLSAQSALRRWYEAFVSAMERSNRNPRVATRLQELMREAGLRDVGGRTMHLPIGAWDQDPTMAGIGRDNVEPIGELLDSFAIWPFTRRLGWTAAQVIALTTAARAELRDVTLKLYIPVYVAWGRRSSRA